MSSPDQKFTERVRAGDLRAVARLITLCENKVPRARKIQRELFQHTGSAHVVGVTGSPGAGKSTLVDQLGCGWRAQGKKVGILAVDPTSPFSGGAVLGDRIRMTRTAEDPGIFIRSMATRGSLGGISKATLDAIHILDAAGFDIILVETVGVGQAEVDIVRTADTCVVVLVPGMGDSVQAIKAGILEIADLFVINKADREGVQMLHKDIRMLLSLEQEQEGSWKAPIVHTIATKGDGVSEVIEEVDKHREWLAESQSGKTRRLQILRERIISLASDILYERSIAADPARLDKLVSECYERRKDPYQVVEELLAS